MVEIGPRFINTLKQALYYWATFPVFGIWRQSLTVYLKLASNRWFSCLRFLSTKITDVWASNLDKDFEVVSKLLDITYEVGLVQVFLAPLSTLAQMKTMLSTLAQMKTMQVSIRAPMYKQICRV